MARQLIRRYGGTVSGWTDDEQQQHPQACPPGCGGGGLKRRRSGRDATGAFGDEQMESALEIMRWHALEDVGRSDFAAFGRKLSWQQLAQGCVVRVAGDLVQLAGLRRAVEWSDLLAQRLEARRAASVRTTKETSEAISTLHALGRSLWELDRLRDGRRVADVDGALGRASVVRRRWVDASTLVPSVRPRTAELERLVREATERVVQGAESAGTKAVARRVQAQWAARPAEGRGERVMWDSD